MSIQTFTAYVAALPDATTTADADTAVINQGGTIKEAPLELISPVGSVIMTAAAAAPDGWLLCNGQAVSRSTYSNLFTAIADAWGVGDGSTTFNVPDMRESSPYGVGTYSSVAGTTHGSITAHDALVLGQFADDREQGFKVNTSLPPVKNLYMSGPTGSSMLEGVSVNYLSSLPVDGGYGTPRIGTTTHGKIIGINFIIKY